MPAKKIGDVGGGGKGDGKHGGAVPPIINRVPEPGTLPLLLLGLAGVFTAVRRRPHAT